MQIWLFSDIYSYLFIYCICMENVFIYFIYLFSEDLLLKSKRRASYWLLQINWPASLGYCCPFTLAACMLQQMCVFVCGQVCVGG